MSLIALDYDGTYTADPELWDLFIEQAKLKGHTVLCVTMRYEHEGEELKSTIAKAVDVIYTKRKAKQNFLNEINVYPDIWIDDSPHWIFENSI